MAEEEAKVEEVEEEMSEEEEQKLRLPFPTATVVREMKKSVDSGKMIKKDVKIAMNKFLGEVVKDVTKRMNENPYTMMDLRMFNDAVKPYKQIKELDSEKTRLEAHMDTIIQDCMSIKRDLESKFAKPTTDVKL